VTYIVGFALDLAGSEIGLWFYAATYLLASWFTVQEAWANLRHGKLEVDLLMIVAAYGAACVGLWAEGAVLLALFSLGHALEEYAMGKATKNIEALGELAPRTALVLLNDGSTESRPVEQLQPGDLLLVQPNSRIPADGFVLSGSTSVDQSAVTGESIPVQKTPFDWKAELGDGQPVQPHRKPVTLPEAKKLVELGAARIPDSSRLFAGTVNGNGAITMQVVAAASDSTLARVIALVEDAQSAQSPTQLKVKKVERVYVPIVIAVVAALLIVPPLFGVAFNSAFLQAMTVLVAASPCALAIATPAATLSGISRAARAGVLVKGGAALEMLGEVDAMAFDKTGTLTWGQPRLTDVIPAKGVTRTELEDVVRAVELGSDHPLANAILAGIGRQGPLTATGVQAVVGRGVRGMVDGRRVVVGSFDMLRDAGIKMPPQVQDLQDQGRTVMLVGREGTYLGLLAVQDTPKTEARATLEVLHSLGVRQEVMFSGDNQSVATAIGNAVGVDEAKGGLLPEQKVAGIRALQQRGFKVAMVGDGVNDAPALAQADLGIAMGAAGSAVALETCDVALMSDDLGRVPFARRLSQATSKIVKQNLFIALAVVAVLVPAGLLGLNIAPIVLLHEGSTVLVVLNGLRLLNHDKGGDHRGIEHEDKPVLVAA
jgi:Cd2+/Zn2+-exporting ATPase